MILNISSTSEYMKHSHTLELAQPHVARATLPRPGHADAHRPYGALFESFTDIDRTLVEREASRSISAMLVRSHVSEQILDLRTQESGQNRIRCAHPPA